MTRPSKPRLNCGMILKFGHRPESPLGRVTQIKPDGEISVTWIFEDLHETCSIHSTSTESVEVLDKQYEGRVFRLCDIIWEPGKFAISPGDEHHHHHHHHKHTHT